MKVLDARRWMPRVVILAAVANVAAVVVPRSASAACDDWEDNDNKNGLWKFRINAAAITNYGLSAEEARQAVILGSAVWNEQGNTGHFRYIGTTSLTVLPTTLAGCNDPDGNPLTNDAIDYSIVVFKDDCHALSGQTQPRCVDGAGKATQWLVEIHRKFASPGCGNRDIGNGAHSTAPTTRDLAGLAAHEFGHFQNLYHPTAGEYGVMDASAPEALQRDLYEWDLSCGETLTTFRQATGYSQTCSSTGCAGESAMTASSVITKASSGVTKDAGVWYWASGQHRRTSTAWVKNPAPAATPVTLSSPGATNGVGFVLGPWRENDAIDRVFYSFYDDDGTDGLQTSTHVARQIRSSSEFAGGTQNADTLFVCESMTGWLTCTDVEPVRTGRPIATAWVDGSLDRTVTAWLHQDHSSNGENPESNEIRISVGHVDDDTLSQPTLTGLRSAVGPGVACQENWNGSYDCLLAYVPIDDMTNPVKMRRFSISAGTYRYVLSIEGSDQGETASQTATSITAWYNTTSSEMWVAYRDTEANQYIEVLSTTNGTSWTWEYTGLAQTIQAPNAASAFVGTNNLLVYSR